MAVLGLRFCARAFSSCGEWGPLFIAVHGPLTIAASLVVEHRLQTRRLSSCGSRLQPLRGMWDPHRPGFEPMSPALAGRHSTTAPPGKPENSLCVCVYIYVSLQAYSCIFVLTCNALHPLSLYVIFISPSGLVKTSAYQRIFSSSPGGNKMS